MAITFSHVALSTAGINAILYYAPTIFRNLGLVGNANSLLATGVVGIVLVKFPVPRTDFDTISRMFLATIPAVLWVDQLGRKPVLISGAFLMGTWVSILFPFKEIRLMKYDIVAISSLQSSAAYLRMTGPGEQRNSNNNEHGTEQSIV